MIKIVYKVAGVEFPELKQAESFEKFLLSLAPKIPHPPSTPSSDEEEEDQDQEAEGWSDEVDHRGSALAVIETLRYFVNVPSYAKPWQVWDAALQAGFSPAALAPTAPPPPMAKKKVSQPARATATRMKKKTVRPFGGLIVE